jgi:Xaa-Pro dipeptidase
MLETRHSRLVRAMRAAGLEAVALNPGPSLFYLTGLTFHLMERPVIALFTPDHRPGLVLPELERAKAEASEGLDLYPYTEDEESRLESLKRACASLGLPGKRIGIEPLRFRAYELWLLEKASPGSPLVSADGVLGPLRVAKDEAEVAAIRQAVAIAESALAAALPLIRIGMTERELASELSLQLLRAGSDPELPFSPIVASGPNSAVPHAVPGDRPLQAGDLLVLDWGATYRGYISDLTRTLAVGHADSEFARVHEVVQQANAAGRWSVMPEGTCAGVDQAARAVIAASGYGDNFTHRTGHGIGLEAHEPPYIRADNSERLLPGMVFTVEPGIYLPGRGGVRVEDNVLVTAEGGESLTSFPRDLKVVG